MSDEEIKALFWEVVQRRDKYASLFDKVENRSEYARARLEAYNDVVNTFRPLILDLISGDFQNGNDHEPGEQDE